MAETKTKPTEVAPADFIAAVEPSAKRADAEVLKLADIDLDVLEQMAALAWEESFKDWPED